MTRVLAKELGPKRIRVNAINPGSVETEARTNSASSAARRSSSHAQRSDGWDSPDNIASVAVFLAPASGWMTGETIAAGGGYS